MKRCIMEGRGLGGSYRLSPIIITFDSLFTGMVGTVQKSDLWSDLRVNLGSDLGSDLRPEHLRHLGLPFFTSLNHQLFKNIECVGYFWHFVIGCICVFANLYFCICVFDSNKCNFWFPWTQAFQKYNICWVYWHFVIFCIWVFVYLWIFICEYDSP